METIKFYIDFFGGGDAEKAWEKANICPDGKKRWREWVSAGNDPFAFVPPHGWEWLKRAAVSSLNATAEMLEKGLADEFWLVRQAAFMHPNVPAEVLLEWAGDAQWQVRKVAFSHPNATAEMLEKGAKDEHWRVRQAAEAHPNYCNNKRDNKKLWKTSLTQISLLIYIMSSTLKAARRSSCAAWRR